MQLGLPDFANKEEIPCLFRGARGLDCSRVESSGNEARLPECSGDRTSEEEASYTGSNLRSHGREACPTEEDKGSSHRLGTRWKC